MKVSPILYMGNKRKLISKGLIELFPKDINVFLEPFAGSCAVSMNVQANKYVINDINTYLFSLYKMFQEMAADDIINHIEKRIDEYNLPREQTKRNVYLDKKQIDIYKNSYNNFRDFCNANKTMLDFYTLTFFSFSQQFRMNSNWEFNMPFGNDCFTKQNKKNIKDGCEFFKRTNLYKYNKSFLDLDYNLSSEDFVYLDPPYLISNAVYQQQNQWTEQDEKSLYDLCDTLNNNHIKFALSNVIKNRGKENKTLIKWSEKYEINYFDMNYTACGNGSGNSVEVLITNYVNTNKLF